MTNTARVPGGLPQAASAAPALPALDQLEALAAATEPDPAAAWWIAHQVIEHCFSMVARTDPLTGAALPQSLADALADLDASVAVGRRPFPHDRLFAAARFAAEPFAQLLARHRQRIVRTHAQVPLYQLREIDNRAVAWLARQPGRTVREKLAGRTHALGVRRAFSADTSENRLLGAFARLLVRRATERLDWTQAYDDDGTVDRARIAELAGIVHLCDERLRRSALAELPALTHIRANNVLLGDPLYAKVYRAWKWLRDEDEALRRAWPDLLMRVRTLLGWLVTARLCAGGLFEVADDLARVLRGRDDGEPVGLAVLASGPVGPRWVPNPPTPLLVRQRRANGVHHIRITADGRGLAVDLILVGKPTGPGGLRYEVTAEPDPPVPGRGIGLAVREATGQIIGTRRGHADLQGLRELAAVVSGQILRACQLRLNPADQPGAPTPGVALDGPVGIGLDATTAQIVTGTTDRASRAAWTLACALPDGHDGVEWLDGQHDRRVALGAAHWTAWCLGDVLDPDPDADPGLLSLAARRLVEGLDIPILAGAQVAWTLPDGLDAFAQRALSTAVSGACPGALAVWRSVAAATAWGLSITAAGQLPQPGTNIAVVDLAFDGVSVTLLSARHDPRLLHARPDSGGLYWERKPPLPPAEALDLLGWQRVLRDYGRRLVSRALNVTPDEPRMGRIVRDLVRTGELARLIESGGMRDFQIAAEGDGEAGFIQLRHDQDWFSQQVEGWLGRLRKAVDETLKGAGRIGCWLMVGSPDLPLAPLPAGRQVGRVKFFNEDEDFGFIETGQLQAGNDSGGAYFRPEPGKDVFLPASAVADVGAGRLFPGRFIAFDVATGRKRPEARDVLPLSPLLPQQAITLEPHQLAAGARECLLRWDAGCPAWTEWLPDLALEIIRDGNYGELPLLEPDTVDPLFGASRSHEPPETLTLPRGRSRYTLPLILDRQSRRPLALEARLESAAFPLDRDLPVRLRLDYRYGVDRSYTLTVLPIGSAAAPFERLTARWVSPGETDGALSRSARDALLAVLPSSPEWDKFLSGSIALDWFGDPRHLRFLYHNTERCWSAGRSLTDAPPEVQDAFPLFRERLLQAMLQSGEGSDIPRELEILACLHQDAPAAVVERILHLEQAAGVDPKTYGAVARLLGLVVGDGTGERAGILSRLLTRLERHSSPDDFNPGLVRSTMTALTRAVWRHPGLIATLAATPDAPGLLLGQCRRSLTNLLVRVPDPIPPDEHERIGKLYGGPYRDSCELLLALLRSEAQAPPLNALRQGSLQGTQLARGIRQLDGRFTAARIELRWSVVTQVPVPDALHRMSPIAWALSRYLAPGDGLDLLQQR